MDAFLFVGFEARQFDADTVVARHQTEEYERSRLVCDEFTDLLRQIAGQPHTGSADDGALGINYASGNLTAHRLSITRWHQYQKRRHQKGKAADGHVEILHKKSVGHLFVRESF